MADNIFDRNYGAATSAKADPKSAIEAIARETKVPVNILIAAGEAVGVTDPSDMVSVATRAAKELQTHMDAGASIEDAVTKLTGDPAVSSQFLTRAKAIGAELYPIAPQDPAAPKEGGGFTAAVGSGVDMIQQGLGSAVEGLGKVTGMEGVQQYGADVAARNAAEADAGAAEMTQWSDVDGLGSGAKYVGEIAGQNAPQMALSMGAGYAGALGGAAIGSVIPIIGTAAGAVIGGLAGGLSVNIPLFYGQNRERQKEAIAEGYISEMDEGAAFLSAIPQAAMDTLVDRFLVSKFLKPDVLNAGGILTRTVKNAATGVATEVPTEIGQQIIERAQAGLPLDNEEAFQEYTAAGIAAGILGGGVSGASGALSKDSRPAPPPAPPAGKLREALNKGAPVAPPAGAAPTAPIPPQPDAPKGAMAEAAAQAPAAPALNAGEAYDLQIKDGELVRLIFDSATPLAARFIDESSPEKTIFEIPIAELAAMSITPASPVIAAPLVQEGKKPDAPKIQEVQPADAPPMPEPRNEMSDAAAMALDHFEATTRKIQKAEGLSPEEAAAKAAKLTIDYIDRLAVEQDPDVKELVGVLSERMQYKAPAPVQQPAPAPAQAAPEAVAPAPVAPAAPVAEAPPAPAPAAPQDDDATAWEAMNQDERADAVKRAGYVTGKGGLSTAAKKFVQSNWADLPEQAKPNVKAALSATAPEAEPAAQPQLEAAPEPQATVAEDPPADAAPEAEATAPQPEAEASVQPNPPASEPAPAPDAPAAAPVESDPLRAALRAGMAGGVVEHVTKKGKTLRGYLVPTGTVTGIQIEAVDEFSFRKDAGMFVRAEKADAFVGEAAPAPQPQPAVDDVGAPTGHLSFTAIAYAEQGETLSSLLEQYNAAFSAAGFPQMLVGKTEQNRAEVFVPFQKKRGRTRAIEAANSVKAVPYGDKAPSKAQPYKGAPAPQGEAPAAPPVLDDRREARMRQVRNLGKQAGIDEEARTAPDWMQGDAELVDAWLAGYGDGIAERTQSSDAEGPFGPIITGYEGDWKGAALELERRQTGEAPGALSHPDVGPIAIVWGQEGTRRSDGYGLAKLIAWHPEVLDDLQGRIAGMRVTSRTENRIQLESKGDRAGIRLDWDGKEGVWLIGAYSKDAPRLAEKFTGTLTDLWGSMAPQPQRDTNETSGNRSENQPAAPDAAKPATGILSVLSEDKQKRADELKAKLAAKARNQISSGVDPEYLTLGGELVALYIEAGTKRFGQMLRDFAESTGLTMRQAQAPMRVAYNYVRDEMDLNGDDVSGMDSADQVMAEIRAAIAGEADAQTPSQEAPESAMQEEPAQENSPNELPAGSDRTGEVGEGREREDGGREPLESGQPDANRDEGNVAGEQTRPVQSDEGVRRSGRTRARNPVADDRAGEADGAGGLEPVGRPDGGVPRTDDAGRLTPKARSNYVIADPEALFGGTPKRRFAKNRAAIEAFQRVTDESREPTQEELDDMAAYIGWGSFGQNLFQGTWERPIYQDGWRGENDWLREHLGKDDWKAAQNSIINAHYTDPPTVQAMWRMAEQMGFKGGRILEPSMGIGNFFGMIPPQIAKNSDLTGIELDRLTGGMAKLLYPRANVQIMGYEQNKTPDNFYDLVIGNWPFADFEVPDRRYMRLSPNLHDYFFVKALDQVRPGGIVMGITSAGTMDKQGRVIRNHLAKNADLVASFRLPSGAFEKYAGTSVVTDLIILRKREAPILDASAAGWTQTEMVDTPAGTEIRVNEYYANDRAKVLGTLNFGSGSTYGRPSMIVDRPADLMDRLNALHEQLPTDAYQPVVRGNEPRFVANNSTDPQKSVVERDGVLYQVQGDRLVRLEDVARYKVKDAKKTADREAQFRGLIDLRKKLGAVLDADRDGIADAESKRASLKKAYQAFVKAHGRIRDTFAIGLLRDLGDPGAAKVKALETRDGNPAAIMDKATTRAVRSLEEPTIADAFILARNETTNLDLDRIAELANAPREEVIARLLESKAVYRTPGGGFEASDVYLSGNVRQKLKDAMAAKEAGEDIGESIDALKAVIPTDVPYFNIEAKLGAMWIPSDVYRAYIGQRFGLPEGAQDEVSIRYSAGAWRVEFPKGFENRAEVQAITGGDLRPKQFISYALNNQTITIRRRDIDGNEYKDEAASERANQLASELRQNFSEWVWQDPERRSNLETAYNDAMNAIATPSYDGSFMDFAGMAISRGDQPFNLRSHQSNAIWRGVLNGRGIFAHEVGTGKTITMAGLAVESRRYGVARKPLIIAHNANSKSVFNEIQETYPGGKFLYVDNLAPAEIAETLNMIATDDWDGIVIPHSLIDRMALKEETLMAMAAEEIAQYEQEALAAAQEDGAGLTLEMMDDEEAVKKLRSVTAKQLVKARNQIIAKIKKQALQASKEGAVTFEELGIDMVITDECFTFGTAVLTDRGPMPIGEIVENQLPVKVASFNHAIGKIEWKKVMRWYRHARRVPLVEVFHEQGSFVCTVNHNVYVDGHGYKRAAEIGPDDRLIIDGAHWSDHIASQGARYGDVRMVRDGVFARGVEGEAILQRVLQNALATKQSVVGNQVAGIDGADLAEHADKREGKPQVIGLHHSQPANAQARGQSEGVGDASQDWTQAGKPWGQRSFDRATDSADARNGADAGISDQYSARAGVDAEPSEPLQSGSGLHGIQAGGGNRRSDAFIASGEGAGREERRGVASVGVVGLALLEPGSDGEYSFGGRDHSVVYDIEVEDNHNFFANGALVSNSHEFKKPPVATRMTVRGLQKQVSSRSLQLRFLTDYVKGQRGGKGVHVFTGTPITNTLTEIYHQMRYVMDDVMRQSDVNEWDGFFNTFAASVPDVELTAAGDYESVERLSSFVNVAELRRMAGQYMDIVFADDMPEFKPRAAKSGKTADAKDLTDGERDELLNGRTESPIGRPYKKVIHDIAEMDPVQRRILNEVVGHAQAFRAAKGKERMAIMREGGPNAPIVFNNVPTRAGLDVRLHDIEAPDSELSKASRIVRNVSRIYNEDARTTQVIFMDEGYSDTSTKAVKNSDGEKVGTERIARFNLAKDIRDRLISEGIPADQIAIVDGPVSKDKRAEIARKMNNLEIRVVIGQTQTLGVGVNMQENLRAMHHADAPWMPGDLEQRNGRGHRQGNKWNTVLEYRYLTEGLDGRRWQVLSIKDRFIKAFLKADANLRVIEGDATDDATSMGADDLAQTLSEAAGDPRIFQAKKLEKDIDRLQRRERIHGEGIANARRSIRTLEGRLPDIRKVIDLLRGDQAKYEQAREAGFTATVDGVEFDDRGEAQTAFDAVVMRMKTTDRERYNYRDFTDVGVSVQGFAVKAKRLSYDEFSFAIEHAGWNGFDTMGKPSIAAVEAGLRRFTDKIEANTGLAEQNETSIARLKLAVDQPFQQTAILKAKQQQLVDLQADMRANPVAPPSWLRQGAPIDALIYVDGEPRAVLGHRWTDEGWFVLTEEGPVDYTDAQDEAGLPIYDEREFQPPQVNEGSRLRTGEETEDDARESRMPTNPVATLTGDELGAWSELPQLRRKAEKWYRDNLGGQTVTNASTGWKITFANSGGKKTASSKGADLLRIVPALREIIESGRLIGTEADNQGRSGIKAIHKFAATVDLDGSPRDVIATVREGTDGRYYYTLSRDMSDGARFLLREGDVTSEGMAANGQRPLPALEGNPDDLNLSFATPEINPRMSSEAMRAVAERLSAELERSGLAGKVRGRLVRRLADEAGVEIQGRQRGNVIEVNPNAPVGALGVLRHEIVHLLRDADLWGKAYGLFTTDEWRGMVAEVRGRKDLRRRVERDYRGRNLTEAQIIEEMVAEAYREWAQTRDGMGKLGRAFSKIRGFLTALANALRGEGFQSAAMTFERMANGTVGGRGPDGGGNGRGRGADMRQSLNAVVPKRAASTFEQARAAVADFQGKPLVNDATGFVATVSRNTLDKMMSRSAVAKSTSPQLHSLAVANADALFKQAKLGWTKPDRGNDTGIAAIHRFFAVTEKGDGRMAMVKMTVKETVRALDSNPLYTIEAVDEIEAPSAAMWVASAIDADAIDPKAIRSAEDALNMARMVDDFNRSAPSSELRMPSMPFARNEEAFDKAESSAVSSILTDAMAGRFWKVDGGDFNILGLVPGRALFAELGKNLPGARRYLRLKEQMDTLRSEWHGKTDEVATKWRKALSKDGAGNKALMDLMHDATRAGVDPARPFLPPNKRPTESAAEHAARVGKLEASYAKLKPRWDALPSQFKELYVEVRETYREQADAFEQTLINNVRKAMGINVKRAQRAYDAEIERIADEGITGDEKAKLIDTAKKKLATASRKAEWGINARISQLRLQFESNRIDGPYFPLMRYGKYFVTVRDEEGKVTSFSRFESDKKQRAFAKEMGLDPSLSVEMGVMKDGEMKAQVDPNFVAEVESIIGDKMGDPEVMDMVWQRWLETLPDFSVRKSKIHRKGTPGYSGDAFRAFGKQVFHGGHQLARLTYAMDMQDALDDARSEAAKSSDPNRNGLIVNEMDRRHDFAMNPTGSAIAQALTSAAFIYYLGITPAAAIVNLSQTTVVGIPMLAAGFPKGTIGRAARETTRAMADFIAGRADASKGPRVTDEESRALNEAYNRGTIDKSEAHDLAGVAESGVEYSNLRMRIMKPISFLFHHTERMNREVTFLAAYRMARAYGMDHLDGIEKAADLTWKSHFDYQNTSRPRLMQNDFAKVALVFRNFQINMLWRLFRDTHQMMKGKSAEERREARTQLLGITSMMLFHAGITGTWGYALMMMLAGVFFPGGSDDAEDELKRAMIETFGPGAAGLLLKGVPGHLSGLDLTNRMGMPELWFRSSDRQLEGDDEYHYFMEQMVGAVPAIGQNIWRGMQQVGEGNVWRGVETMLPKALRDLMKGYRYFEDGVTTYKGDEILGNVSLGDAFMQALGFSPAQVAERYEGNTRLKNAEKRITGDRQDLHRRATDEIKEGGITQDTFAAIRDFNMANPTYPITPDSIKKSLKSRQRSSLEMEGGIRLNPKLDNPLRLKAPPSLYD